MRNVGSARMRTNRQDYQGTRERQAYIQGSAVKKLETVPVRRESTQPQIQPRSEARRKTQVKSAPMHFGYLAVMVLAIVVVGFVLTGYVRLQADITNRIRNISALETELNNLRLENDETYTKIVSGVDLDEIKRIAINELGMKYAKEGQVITYSGEGNDYVIQFKSIPGED